MDIKEILKSLSLDWDKPLFHKKGYQYYSGNVKIFHDFNWKSVVGHKKSIFNNGKFLFNFILESCPDEKKPILILTESKKIKSIKKENRKYYVVIFPIKKYMGKKFSNPATTFLAGELSSYILLNEGSKIIELNDDDPEKIDTYINKHLSKGSLARWLDKSTKNIKLINSLIEENSSYLEEDLLIKLVEYRITKKDVTALQYRKDQLKEFNALLNNKAYFKERKDYFNKGSEYVWQNFFEHNHWIFGYGLGYVFISNINGRKLEQVVQGSSVVSHGKRIDALMKTRGDISNLCFVEIKIHNTNLLNSRSYRSGCWSSSKELSGAISQMQGTVSLALKSLSSKMRTNDENGYPIGEEIFNYQPKSYIIIGSLNEFSSKHGVNEDKLRSFELFRRNIINPEIITFDELYERAKFIVRNKKS